MSYGVTVNGYVLKPQSVINSEAQADLNKIQDPVTGEFLQLDITDPNDIIAQVTSITLEGVGDGLLDNQVAYNAFDPAKATGDTLSALLQFTGITRKQAEPSTALLNFVGSPFQTIPTAEQIQVTDSNGVNIWLVTQDIIFDGVGIATSVQAESTTSGPIEANAFTLTVLVKSNAFIQQVTNLNSATIGRNEETDSEARQRRDNATEVPSIGLVGGIQSELRQLDSVVFSRVYNNVLITTDTNGIPPKSMAAIVVGGSDQEIAEVILSRNSAPCQTFGNTSVNFVDSQGFIQVISFIRPTPVLIYVVVNISLSEQDVFPADGVVQIQNAIVAYSIGGAPALGITDGFDSVGFQPGATVLHSRLYTPINSIPGHTVDDLFIGLTAAPTLSDDIQIGFDESSEFLTSNILVNILA